MKKSIIFFGSLALLALASCSEERIKMPWEDDLNNKPGNGDNETTLPTAKVGEALPDWTEGCYDIHLVNTGRGECIFQILPDGTTLIVDAGEVAGDANSVPQKPDANTRPYITDAVYIKHFLPKGKTAIDWCAPSHFHIDHIGAADVATETSPDGYKLAGMIALYGEVPFNNVIDMGYPDYNSDKTIPEMDGQLAADWEKFVKWGVSANKFKAARFNVGTEQIKLLNNAEAYPGFKIFNICGNGNVWKVDKTTGGGEIVSASTTKGNPASCGIHVKYGKFDFITCGDLSSAPQNRVAEYCRDAIAPGGFDVFKAHHHLSSNAWGSGMQTADFAPRVIINQSFYKSQPNAPLLDKIATGVFDKFTHSNWTKDFFTTNIHADAIAENPALLNGVKGYNGHVVVRVAPGGNDYYVYILEDSDFSYKVKSIHGPYASK